MLERDFVPARRVKDGVLGMLDLVDGSLYPNCDNEAGDFIAGSNVRKLKVKDDGLVLLSSMGCVIFVR